MNSKPKIYISAVIKSAPNYQRALELAGAVCTENINDADGLLLPGGADVDPVIYGQENINCVGVNQERDLKEIYAVLSFLRQKKPIFGICRGSQLLAAVLGGTLYQNIENHAHNCLHPVKCMGWMADLYGESCIVNSDHHQAVDRIPDCCAPLQWAEDGTLEAYCHKTLPIMAVQWHPEVLCGAFNRPEAVNGLKVFIKFVVFCKR